MGEVAEGFGGEELTADLVVRGGVPLDEGDAVARAGEEDGGRGAGEAAAEDKGVGEWRGGGHGWLTVAGALEGTKAKAKATAKANAGVLRCAQGDDVEQATATATATASNGNGNGSSGDGQARAMASAGGELR